jgi:hypothetical protein
MMPACSSKVGRLTGNDRRRHRGPSPATSAVFFAACLMATRKAFCFWPGRLPGLFGAGPARFGAAVKLNCPYCFGLG